MILARPPSSNPPPPSPLPKHANSPTGIVALVELAQELEKSGRPATPGEQALLASWRGWGPVSNAFEPRPEENWKTVGPQLRMLLGKSGYSEASASTPTSFFTPPKLTRAIWTLASGLGFTGGRVLEAGCGSGAFLENAPPDLPIEFTGIERETFSANLAHLRFPKATIINQGLENVVLVENSFDLVIGNVPFSSVAIKDRETHEKFSLHNYFLYRALRALHPGGLAILITSRYLMDAHNDTQREMIDQFGMLLGALRLPSGALDHTQVITDLVVFQRRSPSLTYEGQSWMNLSDKIVPGLWLNEYYEHQGWNLLGFPEKGHGMYDKDDLVLKKLEGFERQLDLAIDDLVHSGPRYQYPADVSVLPDELVKLRDDGRKEGSYQLVKGDLFQVVYGELVAVTKLVPELTALVEIRHAITALLDAERDLDRTDLSLMPLRNELNRVYDHYIATYGPIHRAKIVLGDVDPETGEKRISRRRPAVMKAFAEDPDYTMVIGLESYDDETETHQKAAIFTERIHVRPTRKTKADTPSEALSLCLDELGRLDLPRIGELLSLEPQETDDYIIVALGDLVYENPETDEWEEAASYLSGNVRRKLATAQKRLDGGEYRFQRNVDALTPLIPVDILPEEIKALLGAPWIPTEDIERFCLELLGAKANVHHNRKVGKWSLTPPWTASSNPLSTSEWGTERMHAYRLIELALNQTVPVIYDVGDDDKRIRNIDATIAAQDKYYQLQAKFTEWIWTDDARATRLAKLYNEVMNSEVPRKYDGSHLTFPGMSAYWQANLYPWQKDFIYQMICNPAALCAHPVGAGKTTSEIAGAMTLKRLGLITKAAVIVPNHLLEQITAEAQRLYPGANILMLSSEDLKKEKRRLFATRIATGNYDLVVMTHSSFRLIGVHPDTENAYIERKCADMREALEEADENDKRGIKRIETAIEKMRQRQQELMKKPHDGGVTFEQLGISYLVIDEFHLYKNLGLPTNIAGLSVGASGRALDLEMKLRWLEEHNQGKPFASGFTATPISNSMVEAYVMIWYLSQKLIKSYGILTLDAFAALFIEFQTRVEVSPNGASFQLKTRASNFVNFPELMALFAQVCDLRSNEILSAKRPTVREHIEVIEPSRQLTAYVDMLVERNEDIHNGCPQTVNGVEDNMLLLTSHGRWAALDLSLVGMPQDSSPKLEAVVRNMVRVYQRWQAEAAFLPGEFKSLQIGFCDIGTPSKEKGDQIYGKLKMLLEMAGIPKHGIRFIHNAKTPAEKARLFEQCRKGDVAILLGSTGKMGTGTNIQERCAALHHIDAPWRPDEVEQRTGRCQRPGNLWPEVEIFRYVIIRTFDAYSWQTLERKAKPWDQMRSGTGKTREFAQSDTALSYGQVKAAATGDPLVLEQAELEMAITQLKRLYLSHARARRRDGEIADNCTAKATYAISLVRMYESFQQIIRTTAHPGFVTTRGEVIAERKELGEHIALSILPLIHRGYGITPLGTWSGVPIAANVRIANKDDYVVNLLVGEGETPINLRAYPSWLGDGQTYRFVDALKHFFEGIEDKKAHEQKYAEEALEQANGFRLQSTQLFSQQEEFEKRMARKREIDTYTNLVAGGMDEEKQAVATLMREKLLADAPVLTDVFSTSSVPTKVMGPVPPKLTLDDLPTVEVQPSLVFGSAESIALLRTPVKRKSTKKGGTTKNYAMPAEPSLWLEEDFQVQQVTLWG